jgi:hypothetical protein
MPILPFNSKAKDVRLRLQLSTLSHTTHKPTIADVCGQDWTVFATC